MVNRTRAPVPVRHAARGDILVFARVSPTPFSVTWMASLLFALSCLWQGDSSVVEQPPRGEGKPGPYRAGGFGELDIPGFSELFESAGDAAVVPMEQVSGLA